MDNGNHEPAGTDLDALLAGAKTQEERDKTTAALHHFQETHPDSFAGELAVLLQAHARSVHAAAGRIEKAIRDGSPKALAKTLEVVQKNSQDQADALARYPKWTFALNASSQIIIAVMGFLFGGWVVGTVWYIKHQARTRTTEYMLEQTLDAIHSGMDYGVADNGRRVTIRVLNPAKLHPKQPGNWIPLNAYTDADGSAVITFIAPADR